MSPYPRSATSTPAAISAAQRVLSLPELLSSILHHLSSSPHTLLLAQRTSKTFYATITQTPSLQSLLFYTATCPTTNLKENQPITFNPLLASLFPLFFALPEWPYHSSRGIWDWDRDYKHLYDLRVYAWHASPSRRAAVLRPGASWRRMYPLQPATRIERVLMTGGCGCGGMGAALASLCPEAEIRQKEGGAMMGLWWDVVVWMSEEWPYLGFCIDWGGGERTAAIRELPDAPARCDEVPEKEVDEADVEWMREEREENEREAREAEEGDEGGRPVSLFFVHTTECFSVRGDEVGVSGLRVGDGGFVGVSDVVCEEEEGVA